MMQANFFSVTKDYHHIKRKVLKNRRLQTEPIIFKPISVEAAFKTRNHMNREYRQDNVLDILRKANLKKINNETKTINDISSRFTNQTLNINRNRQKKMAFMSVLKRKEANRTKIILGRLEEENKNSSLIELSEKWSQMRNLMPKNRAQTIKQIKEKIRKRDTYTSIESAKIGGKTEVWRKSYFM